MSRSFLKRKNSPRAIFFAAFLAMHGFLYAADEPWAVSRIPAELLKNANAVLRLEELHFELINAHSTTFRNRYVITILDESGDHWAQFIDHYDKFNKIVSLEGRLYDGTGKEIRKTKAKDFEDRNAGDGSNLIDDVRVKLHNFYYKVYPYTVEYEVVTSSNSTLFFPGWIPQGEEKLAVEKSSVSYEIPETYRLRYQAFNYKGEPLISTGKGKKTLQWSVSNLPAFINEPYQPPLHEITTYVAFAPTEFQVEGYSGVMDSWQALGKFQNKLNEGRAVLPPGLKQKVYELTAHLQDPYEKIRVLYEYMQKNTRYVSIQLGIGGWQPFEANFVATKGYGDCKALTNFMHSLLKEAGIRSHYSLIRAGRENNPIKSDFPSRQFNHVILSVPMSKDTVWLECTSQTLPAGYLGDFTCDRFALVVNEEGGQLVRTPRYGLKENTRIRKINAVLDEDASLDVKSFSVYHGLRQDLYHDLVNGLSRDKLKEFLQDQLDFATYDINDFAYQSKMGSLPYIQEELSLTASKYATITGKRLFILPNVMTRKQSRLSNEKERKFDIVLNMEYRDLDSVVITIPAGYSLESVPQDVNIKNQFGKYTCSYKLESNRIIYRREMEQHAGRFPAKEFSELVKFHDAIYKADRSRMVLVKN